MNAYIESLVLDRMIDIDAENDCLLPLEHIIIFSCQQPTIFAQYFYFTFEIKFFINNMQRIGSRD